MVAKNRVDTEALFTGLINQNEKSEPTKIEKIAEVEKQPTGAKGRPPETEKRIQTSIYFTENQIIKIDEQTGIRGRKKERDRSTLVREAVNIVLELNYEEYKPLKEEAEKQGKKSATIVKEALAAFLK